ncbi:MAG: aldo/keto reductase [Treponema sp.]|nr:aldo/keto reductase [Treponema sp.]
MQYRIDKKTGWKLSVLGLGCMRFPRNLGNTDMKKAEKIILSSIDNGINYFDTAWMYRGNEEALGTIMERNRIRDKVYLATKLPAMLIGKPKDLDHFLKDELKDLRTDHIDYYLIHNLPDLVTWEHLVKLGIESWISENKKNGRIAQIGFSFHGTTGEFLKILDAYPWEFCQIQYNYSDENYQAGVTGLKKAAETMPVIIMEPLLGGKLANNLPKEAQEIFRKTKSNGAGEAGGANEVSVLSPAAWGLRWLWNQEEVTVVLSGMNDPKQVTENCALTDACAAGSLTEEELAAYRQVKEVFNRSNKILCTGCAYCMPCPNDVNIPGCFAAYNTSYIMGWVAGMHQYMTGIGIVSLKSYSPANCTGCGKCESHCPQKIAITESLKMVRKRMEPVPIRLIIKAVRAFFGLVKKQK